VRVYEFALMLGFGAKLHGRPLAAEGVRNYLFGGGRDVEIDPAAFYLDKSITDPNYDYGLFNRVWEGNNLVGAPPPDFVPILEQIRASGVLTKLECGSPQEQWSALVRQPNAPYSHSLDLTSADPDVGARVGGFFVKFGDYGELKGTILKTTRGYEISYTTKMTVVDTYDWTVGPEWGSNARTGSQTNFACIIPGDQTGIILGEFSRETTNSLERQMNENCMFGVYDAYLGTLAEVGLAKTYKQSATWWMAQKLLVSLDFTRVESVTSAVYEK